MNKFRMDNTEGYSQDQLDELNQRFNQAAHGATDESEVDHIAERVQSEFDTELSAA